MKRCLLDCTLRDGGYLNDWNFGHDDIIAIFNALHESKVSYVEVGFLDDSVQESNDRTIQPNTEAYNKLFAGVDKGDTRVTAMIDYGHCNIDNIEVRDRNKTFIDFIRVIFKKDKMEGALAYIDQVQKKGYHVFAQMVSITSYDKNDLKKFVKLCNTIKPFAVSIVDTYGLLYKKELRFYYQFLDRHLKKDIRLGFHAHNNFQLAYMNCLSFLKHIEKRNVLVDGTLFGMGKSAGNAPIELLINTLNANYFTEYDINPVLRAIDKVILPYRNTLKWGYQLDFFICGSHRCHPSYVSFLRKNGLDAEQINDALKNINDENKRLLYSEDYAKELLEKFHANK